MKVLISRITSASWRAEGVVVGVSNPNDLRRRQAFSVLRDGHDHRFFALLKT